MANPVADALAALEAGTEKKYGLPSGILSSVRQQETGGKQEYIDTPDKYHYAVNADGRRVAGHTGKVSTAFGPYGIVESTAKQPGYGTTPLKDKSLNSQVDFAGQYLAGRIKNAGSVEAGLAGYGEGTKYANQVLKRMGTPMATTPAQTSQSNAAALGNQVIERNDAAAQALARINEQQQQVFQSAQNVLTRSSTNAETVTLVDQLAQAKAQSATLDFANKIGAAPGAANDALTKLVQQSAELFDKQRAVAARLENAGNPRTMFDKPLTWLSDYILIPHNKQRLEAVNAQLDSTNKQIKWINDTTQDYGRTQNAIAQTKTAGTAAAAAQLAADKFTVEAAETRNKALATNADSLLKTTQLSNTPFDVSMRITDQLNQEAAAEDARVRSKLAGEELEIRVKDRATAAEGKKSYLDTYNLGAGQLGMTQFKTFEEYELAFSQGIVSKEGAAIAFQNGFAQNSGAPGGIASTPVAALTWYAKDRPALDPGRTQLITKLAGTYNDLSNSQDKNIRELMRPNGRESVEGTNKAIANQAKTYLNNITVGDNNIYKAPPLATVLENPSIAASHLGKNILTPLGASGSVDIPWKQAMTVLINDVRTNKISVEQADSEIKFLATYVAAFNDDMYRYKQSVGLPNMRDGFKVPLEVPAVQGFFNLNLPTVNTVLPFVDAGAAPIRTQPKLINLLDDTARSEIWTRVKATTLKAPPTTSKVE